jgi:hypothetical protein
MMAMLAGGAVVALWNDVVPEGLAAFHAWHIGEHMPERVGIPGFRRGRRYAAADAATRPGFFTLYEVATMAVLSGAAYSARLNDPTQGTQANIPNFRNTVRALAEVVESRGIGVGGAALTIRVAAEDADAALLGRLAREALALPRIVGAHLCRTDAAASGVVTREKQGRTVLERPPGWFLLVEATDAGALASALPDGMLAAAGVRDSTRGVYRLEQLLDSPAPAS